MGRVAITSLALAATAIATVTYKYVTADDYERSCGFSNLFRWDYSEEIRKGIRVVKNGSDIAIDFTNLKRWNRICLASMYEDDFYPIPTIDGRSAYPDISYRTGKWQCGGVDRMITIVLLGADGGGLARKFFLPPELKRDVWVHYGSYTPTEKFRQCSDIPNAIARCEAMPGLNPGQCILMFPKHEKR